MLVKFRDNLGTRDACGLDVTKCTSGAILDVADDVGARLVRLKLADVVEITTEATEPKLKAVPPPVLTVDRQTIRPQSTKKES